SNLDNNAQNVNYSYRIFNSNGSVVNADYSSIEWSDFVLPFIENGVYTKNSNVVLIYPIAPLLDSNQFIVKQWIRGDDAAVSDSISFVQSFSNYYAYDDGTPEAGYGITPAESKMALHFSLNHKDTLRAIDIFFNSTKERNNPNYLESFNFVIWNDNHGKPDNILYEQQMFISSEKTGHFERFYLDEPIQIAAGGIFMGTIQETDANLNIGFDGSNPQQNQLFYKTPADNWKNSEFEGSLLFRPVFGKAIHDYPDTTTAAPKSLTVAPNPNANSSRTFQILLNYSFQADEHDLKVEVFNMLGQRVYAAPFTASVTLGNVSSGIYIVRVSNYTTGYVESTKLIIQ
ncbi:MAG: T9SS type A sorting domain-containing protein, partial [Bacteroidales bacterium]|nr:T9SS type A sorting domain-containing protein [Bacteroidales bacterium]